jgi:hypothetical protein
MDIAAFLALPLEERRNLLKRLLAQTVPRGAVKEIAYAAGLSDYTLYKCRDEACDTHNLIRPELLHILHLTQNYALLDFMEGLFGRVAARRPPAAPGPLDLSRETAGSMAHFAELLQGIADSLDKSSPGGEAITAAELAALERTCTRLLSRLATLMQTLRQACRTGGERDGGQG